MFFNWIKIRVEGIAWPWWPSPLKLDKVQVPAPKLNETLLGGKKLKKYSSSGDHLKNNVGMATGI